MRASSSPRGNTASISRTPAASHAVRSCSKFSGFTVPFDTLMTRSAGSDGANALRKAAIRPSGFFRSMMLRMSNVNSTTNRPSVSPK